MLEGDPAASPVRWARASAADQAWQEGLRMTVPDAVTLARGGPAA